MNAGFTGTRHGMTPLQKRRVAQILSDARAITFHHGDCVGADAEAHEIAIGVSTVKVIRIHPPQVPLLRAYCKPSAHDAYGGPIVLIDKPLPYLKRDRKIVEECDFLIACPQTVAEVKRSGTWYTIRYARSVGKTVHVIPPVA